MADIKTRDVKKDIKIFDKSLTVGDKMKDSYIRTKNSVNNLSDDNYDSPNEYAESNIRNAVEDVTKDTARGVKKATKSVYKKGRELYRTYKDVKRTKDTVDKTKKTVKKVGKETTKTVKRSVKTTKKTVKTAEKTSKAAIKTTKAAAKTAQEAAKASAKAAKVTAQAMKAAAKATAMAVKVAVKATVAAIKAIIAAIKALAAAIAAGGWVAVVIIIVIVLIALIIACFGILFSDEDTGTGMTMQTAISEINSEYQAKVEEIKNSNTYDTVEIADINPVWKDVLAVYAAKTTFDPNNPQEVASMDEGKKEQLKGIFWSMVSISSSTETKTESVPVESVDSAGNVTVTYVNVTKTYLYITVTHKTPTEMAASYNFNAEQNQLLNELLSEQYADFWDSLLSGISACAVANVEPMRVVNVVDMPFVSRGNNQEQVNECNSHRNEIMYLDYNRIAT